MLAVGDDGERGRLAVAPSDLRPAEVEHDREHPVGEFGQMVREPLDGQPPGEVLGEQAEDLRVMGLAQHVHAPLEVGLAVSRRGGGQAAAQLVLPGR